MATSRLTVTLTGEALDMVQQLAQQRGVGIGEVMRRAIGHERWLWEEHFAGSRIYALSPDGKEQRHLILS